MSLAWAHIDALRALAGFASTMPDRGDDHELMAKMTGSPGYFGCLYSIMLGDLRRCGELADLLEPTLPPRPDDPSDE